MNFGDSLLNCLRKRVGKSFRKSLGVYHYKIGHQQYHKEPGVIPLHMKEKFKKVKKGFQKKKIWISIFVG